MVNAYFFFLRGAWARAEAAAVFSILVAFGFCNVLLAAVAAALPVCFGFLVMVYLPGNCRAEATTKLSN